MGEFATKTGAGDNNYRVVTAHDNPQDDKYGEIVGSTDLSGVLREHGYIRGTFAINGAEYRGFMATSPGEVVSKLNEKSAQSGVKASLDDKFHLVLESDGNGEPRIASGAGFEKAQRAQLIADRDARIIKDGGTVQKETEPKEEKDVLELLGLEANEDHAFGGVAGDWAPGGTAEDRETAREARKSGEQPAAMPFGGGTPGEQHERALRQGKTGGGTTQMNTGVSPTQKGGTDDGKSPGQNVQPGSARNPGTEGLPGDV